MKKLVSMCVLVALFCVGIVACDKAEPTKQETETAGKNIEDAVNEIGSDAKDFAKKTAENGKVIAKDAKDFAKKTAENSKEIANDVKNSVKEMVSDIPKFKDSAVQEYVNSYEVYMNDYAEAVKSKSMTSFAALGKKGQELSKMAIEMAKTISAEDSERLSNYLAEKAKKMQTLTQELQKQ